MINIDLVKQSVSLEELDQEIKKLQDLRNEMIDKEIVDTEYHPGILHDEIMKLIKRRIEIQSIVEKNYEYYGKGRNH